MVCKTLMNPEKQRTPAFRASGRSGLRRQVSRSVAVSANGVGTTPSILEVHGALDHYLLAGGQALHLDRGPGIGKFIGHVVADPGAVSYTHLTLPTIYSV